MLRVTVVHQNGLLTMLVPVAGRNMQYMSSAVQVVHSLQLISFIWQEAMGAFLSSGILPLLRFMMPVLLMILLQKMN